MAVSPRPSPATTATGTWRSQAAGATRDLAMAPRPASPSCFRQGRGLPGPDSHRPAPRAGTRAVPALFLVAASRRSPSAAPPNAETPARWGTAGGFPTILRHGARGPALRGGGACVPGQIIQRSGQAARDSSGRRKAVAPLGVGLAWPYVPRGGGHIGDITPAGRGPAPPACRHGWPAPPRRSSPSARSASRRGCSRCSGAAG